MLVTKTRLGPFVGAPPWLDPPAPPVAAVLLTTLPPEPPVALVDAAIDALLCSDTSGVRSSMPKRALQLVKPRSHNPRRIQR